MIEPGVYIAALLLALLFLSIAQTSEGHNDSLLLTNTIIVSYLCSMIVVFNMGPDRDADACTTIAALATAAMATLTVASNLWVVGPVLKLIRGCLFAFLFSSVFMLVGSNSSNVFATFVRQTLVTYGLFVTVAAYFFVGGFLLLPLIDFIVCKLGTGIGFTMLGYILLESHEPEEVVFNVSSNGLRFSFVAGLLNSVLILFLVSVKKKDKRP